MRYGPFSHILSFLQIITRNHDGYETQIERYMCSRHNSLYRYVVHNKNVHVMTYYSTESQSARYICNVQGPIPSFHSKFYSIIYQCLKSWE
jgi:hypothetical protein